MQKETKNPWVINKIKTSKKRNITLADVPFVIRDNGTKGCIWCGEDLRSNHHATRYCKDINNCQLSAYRSLYPQSMESALYLLELQNYKCMICYFNYKEFFQKKGLNEELTVHYLKKHKKTLPLERRIEVDHRIAIVNGGMSLGLDNHQVVCYSCHKEKTKNDLKRN